MSTTENCATSQVPPLADKTVKRLDGISIFFGKAASWLAVPMMLSLIYEVFMRYVFDSPTIWSMDISIMLFGLHFMVGSAYCLQAGQHIRTDFFYHHWSVRTKAAADLLNLVLLFFPAHIVFLVVGWDYFCKSYAQNEVSVASPWMPVIWPVKFGIPLCVALTLLQGASELVKNVYRWKTGLDLWPVLEIVEDVDSE